MHVRSFEAEQWFPLKQEELFAFLSDAANLEAITPAFLNFEIVTPRPIAMGEGTLIDYKLRFAEFRCAGAAKLRRGSRRLVLSMNRCVAHTGYGFTSTSSSRATAGQ